MVAAIAEAVMGPKRECSLARGQFHPSAPVLRCCDRAEQSLRRGCVVAPPAAPAPRTLQTGLSRRRPRSTRANRSSAERSRRPRSSARARDQHLPRLVTHQRRLVHERAHADKPHRRPGHRFTGARISAMHHFERPDAAARRGPERTCRCAGRVNSKATAGTGKIALNTNIL
jgi:hypothetical protein